MPDSVPTLAVLATIPVSLPPTESPTEMPAMVPLTTAVPSHTPNPTDTAVLHPTPPATPLPLPTPSPTTTIGFSVAGRPIVSYRFGLGPEAIILVGGIHGGYEWNTISLAHEMIDYFGKHPELIPASITLHIILAANPDGQFLITGHNGRPATDDIPPDMDTLPGRFNTNGVDLNRNWDCNWSETAVWRDQTISGGPYPFSEPESQSLRDFLLAQQPLLVVFWHSAANGVFASGCPGAFPPSLQMASLYGQAAGYPVYEHFYHYPVTGDAGDWLATQNIPSFSVELKNHTDADFSQNLAGTVALLAHYHALFELERNISNSMRNYGKLVAGKTTNFYPLIPPPPTIFCLSCKRPYSPAPPARNTFASSPTT
ncbi:MAG TPA: M14 family metallopeptidase [Chloroflexota bacterium]|nr:M14 family metallopeptidase [Chloroflexota bacterium]